MERQGRRDRSVAPGPFSPPAPPPEPTLRSHAGRFNQKVLDARYTSRRLADLPGLSHTEGHEPVEFLLKQACLFWGTDLG